MGAAPVDFSKIPISAGKTKLLWDAIRGAGVGPDGGPLPLASPSPSDIMQGPTADLGPANPLPPRPTPNAGPPSVETPNGPTAAPPPAPTGPDQSVNPPGLIRRSLMPPPTPPLTGAAPVGAAPMVNPSTLPSNQRVGDLQAQVDASNAKPSLMQRFKNALPSLLVTGVGAAFGAPSVAQGANAAVQTGLGERDKQRAALIQQVDAAQQTRAAEYGAQQRAQEMQSVAGINSGAKQAVAGTNALSREDVAQMIADAKQHAVETQGQTQRDVAGTRAGATTDAAHISAKARVQAAALTAQAYANRQTRGFDQQDHMQDRHEAAQIDKPTAAEDQRADYNKTLGENLDVLDDLVTRRGDMFGKMGGRITNLKQWVGSDDPDVAVLQAAMGNVGTIVNATHGMRANAAVLRAQHDLANGNLNSPEAFKAAIQVLRDSGNTMNTYTRPTLVKPASAKKPDPLGIR